MLTEFEATFYPIDKDEVRSKLLDIQATCKRSEYNQIRTTMHLPKGHETPGSFIRVRNEGDKNTLTRKQFTQDGTIESQSEIEVIVDNYDQTVLLMKKIGCKQKAVQESQREVWEVDGVQIMIDERPFLEPFVEVEGSNEEEVKKISTKIGFDRNNAIFDSVTALYANKYGVTHEYINDEISEIRFDGNNPFILK